MKKRILSLLLALVMTASMLPVFSVAAADAYSASPTTSDYFYNQLNDRAKAIYNELLHKFSDPATKADYYDGTKPIDLIGVKYGSDTAKADDHIITTQDIEDYQKGNKDIFNDFCAAKDALDLDHSELWYIDSGYLTFRVTHGSVEAEYGEGYHVLIGPGRGETYLLGGLTADEVELNGETIKTMDEKINATINSMVNKAVSELNAANSAGTYSEPDQLAFLATNIHDQITKGIHYRYEIECNYPDDAKFIRTIYGMQTHEGVCEAYARTLQVCLTRLGIQSVLIHGVQTKGTPEDHMWNAVNIPDNGDHWYVVDATWDDPLTAKWDGTRDLSFKGGEDGKETNTYLLVGQSLVGEHWRPSGYVSTGNFEFKYPTIETAAFSGATVLGDDNGLKVDYSTGSSVDGAPAGVFSVTYQGMDAKTARDKGLYFMVKMYDYHPDGTADVMKEWYYADATFVLSEGNPYFGDYDGALRIYTPTCEYVEIAVTTREPDQRDTWENPASSSYLSLSNGEAGYFHGDESEIIAQSGMLYNVNSKYEAPPYVLTQFPAPNGNCTAGYDYRFKVTYDDDLYYRPSANSASGISTVANTSDIPVRVRYATIQQDLHEPDKDKYVRIAGELPFDVNRDGYVDMPGVDGTTNDYVDFKWIYSYEPAKCPNNPNHESNHTCDVTKGCPIKGVEFNFRASDQWIDDITEYNFSIDGVVGSRSSKVPNNFSVISCIPGLCPACYRSQGIDWNLWGQPTLLDAPENLDLKSLASAENDSQAAKDALEKFNEEIHRDEINGRLMLVVEDKSKGAGNREDYERINGALSKDQDYQNQVAGGGEVLSSVFEINFNRVCPMVKLKPNKGQSLRVQVGYPAGVTYETLANYDLKAYHFVRCSNDGESYYCQEVKDALASASDKDKADILKNHKWGEHIIKTEQITIVPTPYGMVIMCDAFSPFEIVAVEKSGTEAVTAAAETGSTLVVVSDGNGHVEVDGKEAVGTAGNVKFANEQDEKTFTVVPDKGYEVDSVILGGSSTPINVSPDGKFTVSGINHNEVLSVTFVPTTVTTAEKTSGYGDAVEVKACPHTTLQEDTSDPTPNADATCTTPGYKKAQICAACGQTVVPAAVIPAKGHTFDAQTKDRTEVTCIKGVDIPQVLCAQCNAVVSEAISIPALGHDFENYTKSGAATCEGQKMQGKCTRCDETSTIINKDAAVGHSFTEEVRTVAEATCSENATAEYKCKWCQTATTVKEVANSKQGHVDTNHDGICDKCNASICGENGHKWETHAKVDATCTTTGTSAYKQCSVCHIVDGTIETIPALGHDFGGSHTAGTQCKRCQKELKSDQHAETPIPAVDPTCDTPGSEGGVRCSQCGDIIKQPTIIPALGHKWNETDAKIAWPTTGHAAYVLLTCENYEIHHLTVNATVTEGEIKKQSTCKTHGTRIYSAVATLPGGGRVTDEEVIADLPLAAHTPAGDVVEIEATCTREGTKEYTCSVCKEHIVEVTDPKLPHNVTELAQGSKAATCTEPGLLKGTCSLCHEVVTQTVAATGHNYVNNVCTHCGAVRSYSAPSGPTVGSTTETVTGADGSKTTTVTASDGSKTTTTTTADGVVGTTKTDADGNVTSVEVIMPYGSETGEAVVAPVKVKAFASAEDAPEIGITVREGSARVEIPVEDVNHGTVAVIVDEDGNETVIRDCAVDKNGVIITAHGSMTVKIVDRSVDFTDVQTAGHWASDAVEFVAARNLFNGTGDGVFSPNTAMQRGMLVTVLHRLAYEPEADSTQITFGDIQSSDYFAEASAWANANHIVEGYNGSFRPRDYVSREDLVTILYRYAKFKGYATETDGNALTSFADVQDIRGYAVDAMNWAVSVGLVNGVTPNKLAPQSGAKRAEVATIIERFCENVVR